MQDALIINSRDLEFQLFEVLEAETLTQRARHADHTRETFNAALETAHAVAADKFAPHNRLSDEQEPQFDGQRVTILTEVKDALDAFRSAGFLAAGKDYEWGGMQLPSVISFACLSLFKSANIATSSYAMLTTANANVIERFGSAAQKRKYLQALFEGRAFGTMALTEPQAGSSLSDLVTSATPNEDGTYSIRGNKIFISGGDHELSENIVHLVLARIPGGPPGVKGISLFTVPKFHVNDDGSRGARNDVALAGLIHKMGWRGTTSTMLSFGERGECIGELVGEPHHGLAYMFHMMNEARIGVGLGAVMLGYRGYLASLDYARERPQGRRPDNKNPLDPQLPLIEHADVRRMLLAQKAYVEGAYALCLYAARLVDEQNTGENDTARAEAGLLLDLLTPIVKSWPSQWCLEANSLAIQIHGGYGYTREYPVEQFYRDNRLNMIHEGTHGIQAIDLLGRKVVMKQGAALKLLGREILRSIESARVHPALQAYADSLTQAWSELTDTVEALLPTLVSESERALANANAFLEAFGHIVIAWTWLRQAIVASAALPEAKSEADRDFYRGKLHACQWFFHWELPRVSLMLATLRSLDDTTLSMAPQWF
ncbi:3-methylmercaptopropionyl-CoA dehydrogenase [Paraburkholderia aspalathi]|uniref:3-methylmercaptopropionyl-CoA dehydrogenase n=1 Tax=Paraburkholderia aspalathi TaxID=1324617 RepID=A0ABM8SMJ3_9BURK|nr:acyl-CoA dehydrogenase [Paraburkholderia aspalathi]MBK3822117.1 acyl-CoA dehydrogenase [Paraburkholderia aspalathi]MBK3833951.1 acyl-CoA dehydrogenase [Paraburkholderia aspalathi]MBK3863674.1 acyl-CoA dehydrogenase [Paraburkholderia aspalathi]CAE6819980.1 3-methylmercaptopropionyl-CoA dehydrogenase [Paraburkholderia aspalathi]